MSDATEPAPASRAQALRTRLAHEMRRYLILFLYLWALFGLFVLNESLVDRSRGSAVVFQGSPSSTPSCWRR